MNYILCHKLKNTRHNTNSYGTFEYDIFGTHRILDFPRGLQKGEDEEEEEEEG